MAHFEIKHLYTVIRLFWAVSTAVCTVKASKKNLQLQLRHSHNHKPTIYVWLIPVTVRHAPLWEGMGYEGTPCGNQPGNTKNIWGIRGYGVSGVWVKRMMTVAVNSAVHGLA